MEDGAVRRLFLRALDLAPETRAAFLDNASAPPEVRAAVLTLLRYDAGSETFLEQAVSSERPHVPDGERFGTYQLGPLLGRGGMGAVFRAERVDGELHQTVAIKIVERGWLDPRAFERFRVERQILASLVHPNIARLLDGGTRDDGLPYLVMEFVDGLRLDQYCEQHDLSLEARLRIFLPLCDAVDYAHRKLIVHRDLKPANVLVTAEGAPKLLDFGVARVLEAGFDARTLTLVLTPGFASPEQVRGDEVTTASDVYGLGAVLYHLLTGRAPHAVENLSPYELQRAICDTPPTPPSEIRPELRGDLQNILLKALDPEPAARYASARELAADIQSYLDHRPVLASPHGPWYRVRRFVRRHTLATPPPQSSPSWPSAQPPACPSTRRSAPVSASPRCASSPTTSSSISKSRFGTFRAPLPPAAWWPTRPASTSPAWPPMPGATPTSPPSWPSPISS